MVKGRVVHIPDEGLRADPLPMVPSTAPRPVCTPGRGWVKTFNGQRRVITFDLPGFGLTGPFAGQSTADDYHGDTCARFVLGLLDALQLPRVVLGGNSPGGQVAARTAVIAPERLASLVLVDAVCPASAPTSMPMALRIVCVPVLNRISEWALPRSLVAQGVAEIYGDPSRVTPELVDRRFELALREGNRHALAMRMQNLVVGFEKVGTLKHPTLIL